MRPIRPGVRQLEGDRARRHLADVRGHGPLPQGDPDRGGGPLTDGAADGARRGRAGSTEPRPQTLPSHSNRPPGPARRPCRARGVVLFTPPPPRRSAAPGRSPATSSGEPSCSPSAATTSSGRPVPSSGWNRVRIRSTTRRSRVGDRDVQQQRPQVVRHLDTALQPRGAAGPRRRATAAARPAPIPAASGPAGQLDPVVGGRDPPGQGRTADPDVAQVDQRPCRPAARPSALRGRARPARARSGRSSASSRSAAIASGSGAPKATRERDLPAGAVQRQAGRLDAPPPRPRRARARPDPGRVGRPGEHEPPALSRRRDRLGGDAACGR